MVRFFNWIKRVIVGWYNFVFHKNTKQMKERLQICMECEEKIKLGPTYCCGLCGCELHAKCASPEEKCLNGKW